MALLTSQAVPVTGLTPSFSAVAASDTISPDTGLILRVKNAGGSADSCVVVIPGTTYGQNNPDVTVNVPASTGDVLIYIPPAAADPTTGLITITHSFTTSVTCALLKI